MADADKKVDYSALKRLFKDSWGAPVFKAKPDAGALAKLSEFLYNTEGAKAHLMNEMKRLPESSWTPENLQQLKENLTTSASSPFSTEASRTYKYLLDDGTEETLKRTALGDTAGIIGQNIKAHPWKTALTGANAVGNVAGLFDNDMFGGQVLGTAAGALIPKLFGMGLNPLTAANVAMIGGNLGALFDNLRAKREQEQLADRQKFGGKS